MTESDSEATESMKAAMDLDGDVTKLRSFYDQWASYYDEDVASHGYGLPAEMAAVVEAGISRFGLSHLSPDADPPPAVLDAGCGTGLVGRALKAVGYRTVDGVDLSAEMVAKAEAAGIYRRLEAGVDLTVAPPAHLARSADLVTVGGVFTVGHIPPAALATASQLVSPGGLLAISVRQGYVDETDFDATSARLVADGLLSEPVRHHRRPYTMDSTGDYLAYQVH